MATRLQRSVYSMRAMYILYDLGCVVRVGVDLAAVHACYAVFSYVWIPSCVTVDQRFVSTCQHVRIQSRQKVKR